MLIDKILFQFGGRLVSWNKQSRSVSISQVVTEEKLVERSVQLETALSQSQLGPYCQAKAEAAAKPCDQVYFLLLCFLLFFFLFILSLPLTIYSLQWFILNKRVNISSSVKKCSTVCVLPHS